MAKFQIHAILSDLHRLLSSYRNSDFVEASRYSSVSKGMREVLRALAQEASSGQQEPLPRNSNDRVAASIRNRSAHGPRASSNGDRILDAVRRSPHFGNNRAMVMFARSIGLKLQANPKDSRERVARRFAALITKLTQEKREEVISSLLSGRSTQTQGWIDVIKSANQ